MGRRKVEGNDLFGSLVNSGLFVFGTVDSVRQQLVEQWNVLLGEHIALVNHYAQMPKDGDRDDRNLPAPNQAGAGRGDRQVVSSRGGARTTRLPRSGGGLRTGSVERRWLTFCRDTG